MLNEESETEQVPHERFTKNVSDDREVKCDLVRDKVPEDAKRDVSEFKDEK